MEIILAAALLPAIILMVYVYKHDKIEKEPFVLLLTLFAFGALSCVTAGILEDLFSEVLDSMNIQDNQTYYIIMCFGIVACSEEGAKLFFLKTAFFEHENKSQPPFCHFSVRFFDFSFDCRPCSLSCGAIREETARRAGGGRHERRAFFLRGISVASCVTPCRHPCGERF